MKWLSVIMLVAALALQGCTITITPIKPKKSYKRGHNHSRSHRGAATKKKSATAPKNIKESWWIENYRKLEEAHGNYTIPDDNRIEPLPDGRFKVPDEVLTHHQDLLLVTPTPKP